MTTTRRVPFARLLLLAVVAGPLALAPAACGRPSPGDCATAPGDDGGVSAVSCTDPSAQRRVLRRLDDGGDCATVPGVSEQVPADPGDDESAAVLCVGPTGVPPERAVNVAQPGACLTDIRTEPVLQTPCSTPGAYRVLSRGTDDAAAVVSGCAGTPGSTDGYRWAMTDTTFPDTPNGVRFCLNHADVDASRSPDLARPGDCLAPLPPGRGQDYQIAACSDPRATQRVVLRGALPFGPADAACARAPGTTATLVTRNRGIAGYLLCLAPV